MTGGDTKTGCIFCKPVEQPLVVFEGTTSYIILNLYPYNNGHLMVVPHRHVATLGELTPEELSDIGRLTQRCEAALSEAYHPHGLDRKSVV